MEAAIDPKFLHQFSSDYKYEELSEEQREVYDSLFAPDEEILVGDEKMEDDKGEMDQIINEAKGGDIKLASLDEEEIEKKKRIEQKEKSKWDGPVFTPEEMLIHKIIGKKVVQRPIKEEEEMDEEPSEDSEGKEDITQGAQEKVVTRAEFVEPVFTDEDFPPLDLDEPFGGEDGEVSEGERELEEKIRKGEELESEFKQVLKSEYDAQNDSSRQQKLVTDKEFNDILNAHMADRGLKTTTATEDSKSAKPEKKPEIQRVTTSSGGEIIFYFGGAKPGKKSNIKNVLKYNVGTAVSEEPAEFTEMKKKLSETKSQRLAGTDMEMGDKEEEVEGEEGEWEDEEGDEEWEEYEIDEEDLEGEEESGEEEDADLDPEERLEKMMERFGLGQKMGFDQRLERDANLPDEMLGLKVFKKTLVPELPLSKDYAAQRVLEEEEEIDFSKPPEIFESKGTREPIVEFPYREKAVSKKEALQGATIVSVQSSSKKKKGQKQKEKNIKESKTEQNGEKDIPEEASEEDERLESVATKLSTMGRSKDESPEERKLRKELIKKDKEERKMKKQKFKEKYKELKKGYTVADPSKGVAIVKID